MFPAPPPTTDYDVMAYPPGSYRQTHPERLATIGTLLGMEPKAVGACRVLEVGCGDGSNLIPLAVALRGSEFLGVDLAPAPIERGRSLIAAAGLPNVRLEAMDLLAFPEDAGSFDYIIAHGFCSWVPGFVRQKWWEVLNKHLAPNGIAYASYNAYPAGHLRMAMRDLMQYHLRQTGSGVENRAAEGRKFLLEFQEKAKGPSVWKEILEFECRRLEKQRLDVIYHDELGDIYRPFLFSEIAEEAGEAGLQFLAEASLRRLFVPEDRALPAAVLAREQYLDFLEFRSFRETLFCRKEIPLERGAIQERMSGLWLASSLRREAGGTQGTMKFRDPRTDGVMQTNDPGLLRILQRLGDAWPGAVSFSDLPDAGGAVEKIGQLVAAGLVELRAHPLVPPKVEGRIPVASPVARVQLAGDARTTNLLHTMVELPLPQVRTLLGLLDGNLTKANLSRACAGMPGGPGGVLDGLYRHGLLLY